MPCPFQGELKNILILITKSPTNVFYQETLAMNALEFERSFLQHLILNVVILPAVLK